jgi:hypothetical protein
MAIRQYLTVAQEAVFNTAPTTLVYPPTASPNAIWIRLDGGNAFTMRPVPAMVTVPYGGGIAVNAFKVSDKTGVAGRLSVILCEAQAKFFLLDWGTTRVQTGGTVPWTTSVTPGDLPSCTIYHAIQYDSATTYNIRAYTGVKVSGWDLDVSEESQIWRLNLDLIGSTVTAIGSPPTFPPPTSTVFPVDAYLFTALTGGSALTLGTAGARASFSSLRISSRNALQAWYFANKYAQRIGWFGRTTTLDLRNVYTAAQDRTDFEALTQNHAASVIMTGATHNATLTMNNVNILNAVADDLPNENVYFQALTLENMWDPTGASGVGEDLHWTIT